MNVKKGIIALLIFPLFIISMMPLSVHADSTTNTAPFIGVNVQVTGYGENQSSITFPALNISEISANQSEARMTGQLNCTSPSTPTSSAPCDVFSFADRNGNSSQYYGAVIDLNLQGYLLKFNGNATVNGINYFFVDYEFILDDSYKGYVSVTDENSVSKTIYVNGNNFHYQRMQDDLTQHTFTITDYQLVRSSTPIMWAIPTESMMFNLYQLNNQREIVTFHDNNNFSIPIYKVNNGDKIIEFPSTNNPSNAYSSYTVVLGISSSFGASLINSYFGKRDGSFTEIETLYRAYVGTMYSPSHNGYFQIMKFKITNFTGNSTGSNLNYLTLNTDAYIIPIYFSTTSNKYISTEFSEKFGLSNMPTSVTSADQQNDTFKDHANDLVTQEQEFTSDMKQNLQQIDTNFTFNNFGNKFMSSAVWVRDQYDHMITNTPFGTLVTFSMLLGLGLLIIGRTVNK